MHTQMLNFLISYYVSIEMRLLPKRLADSLV